jgi:hypothetical protein
MSRTFSTNNGSLESFQCSTRWGCKPNARQIRDTVDCETPTWVAIWRVDQCVAPSGGALSSALMTTGVLGDRESCPPRVRGSRARTPRPRWYARSPRGRRRGSCRPRRRPGRRGPSAASTCRSRWPPAGQATSRGGRPARRRRGPRSARGSGSRQGLWAKSETGPGYDARRSAPGSELETAPPASGAVSGPGLPIRVVAAARPDIAPVACCWASGSGRGVTVALPRE